MTGACAVAIGLSALAGWMFGVAVLRDPLNQLVPLKANGAVGFAALGVSLLLTRARPSRARAVAQRGSAGLAIAIGAATVVEYATAFVVAVFAMIGYGYGIPRLDRVPTLAPIALYSAIAFIVLCFGIAAADPRGLFVQLINSETSGMVAAKRLLPITLLVFPLLGWLQIRGREIGLYSTATGVALMVLMSTILLFVAVLSLTNRLSQLDIQRRIGIEREARLAALVEATNDAVMSSDLDRIVTSWNRAAEELFGYTEAEMLGRSIDVLTPLDWYARGREILAAVAEGHPQRCESVLTRLGWRTSRRVDASTRRPRAPRQPRPMGAGARIQAAADL